MRPTYWQGRRVLVTGHTGFKGAWLCLWLKELGATITGVSLAPNTAPNLFELAGLSDQISSLIFDINDRQQLAEVFAASEPDTVIHMAAQSLVRQSYRDPIETIATNVLGTASLLDVIRRFDCVKSVVVVTSDKSYENREWDRGYCEEDRLGGRDPYSASKGCAEIVTQSMQKSFFAPFAANGHAARIASVRAGNVIGGGDWSEDRLVPDIVRGCLGASGEVVLRNPTSIRPWQHVLEPLRGYLEIAERLTTQKDGIDEAWNFGPGPQDERAVSHVAEAIVSKLGKGRIVVEDDGDAPHEADVLRLDCSKAESRLGWTPLLTFDDAIELTADWYRAWSEGADMAEQTRSQVHNYMTSLAKTV